MQGNVSVLAPLRALAPELDTFAMVPAPALVRLHQDPEEPGPHVSGSALVDALHEAAIDALMDVAGPDSGSALEIVELRQCGGALGRRLPGHGARAGIEGQFVLFTAGLVFDPELGALKRAHIERVRAALAPFCGAGQYLNFAEERVDTSLSFDADTWARLVAVKARLDPENVLHANHAI